ncbi:hypothetical protein [Streptomyces yanii]|uniref:Uncharacterized protein n=1 Tax=Streptomyces yanii TaxID=78510 RepID=A0ABV5R251_9ACTN
MALRHSSRRGFAGAAGAPLAFEIEHAHHSCVPTYGFPEDLRDVQLAPHRTRAAYEQYAAGLLWSAEPMPGWDSERQPYTSFRSGKADNPG